jgi:guanylate kinase
MSESQTASPSKNLLIVISAPSGAGKTTLCDNLLERNPSMTRAITCTTRSPREGEVDGRDYYFLSAEAFLKRVQAGHFLEHATVHGNSYGTLKSEVLGKLRGGADVLLNVDVQGEAIIRSQAERDPALAAALVTIFLTPPSLAELERRLRHRGLDEDDVIEKRLNVARHEILHWKNFDYLIMSDTVGDDFRRAQIIVEAEKLRQVRTAAPDIEV